MEIGPILRSLMHNKARFWLIALEVALTLAIVANCVNWMIDLRYEYQRPTGIDEESVVLIHTEPWAEEFKDEEFVHVQRERDLERLASSPGVIAAAGLHQIPLSGGGSSTGRKPLDSEMDTLAAPYYVVTEDYVEAMGLEIAAGRDFVQADFDERRANEEKADDERQHYNVLLTKAMADAYFPDGDALGRQIQSGGGERINTIVGIVDEMHNSWLQWDKRDWAMLIPGRPGDDRRMRYAVRLEPEAVASAYTELEELMLEINPGRIVTLRTMAEIKAESFEVADAMMKMLSGVIFFLVLVTSLGIVGLTSSAVAQRTRQIGTRRALGATKVDIARYFLVENWVITGFGLLFGVGLTYGLNYLLVHMTDIPKMDVGLLLGGMLLLWVSGVLAALAPAIKATRVAPEVATRTI